MIVDFGETTAWPFADVVDERDLDAFVQDTTVP